MTIIVRKKVTDDVPSINVYNISMKNVRSEEGATFGSLGECVAFLKGASMASRFVGKHDLGDAFIGELNFRAGSKAGYHRSMVVFDNGGATFEDLDDLDEPKKC